MTCPHNMPSPGSCTDCMFEDGLGAPAVPPLTVLRRLEARYPGDCTGCSTAIHVGQAIAQLSDETYRHDFPGCLP